MKARWVWSAALLALGGCTTMGPLADMGVVSQSVSASGHATVVEVTPNALDDPGSKAGTPLRLGARWTSDAPQSVTLVLTYQSQDSSDTPSAMGIGDLEISIDGQSSSFPATKPYDISSGFDNSVAHTVHTSNRGEVPIPYATLQRMVTANDCWLRVFNGRHRDARFSAERLPNGTNTAIVSIRAFMEKVDAVRASRGGMP